MSDCGKQGFNRREFMRTAGAALGAAALGMGLPAALAAAERVTVNGLPGTVLGRTGLKITRISFGGILTQEPPVLLSVIDRGINLVHTSPGYTNGNSIRAFGQVMKTHRDKVVLAVKVRPEGLDQALKTLNTDYADMIIPPMDSLEEISDPALHEAFAAAKQAGKVGHMGFACHTHQPEIIDRMVALGVYDVILMSYAERNQPFIEALGRARQAGIGILAMKGLPKRASSNPDAQEQELVGSLCTAMVDQDHAHTVLASMGSFQAVEMYRGMLETRLGWRDRELEERWWASLEGRYCAMCGTCAGLCPEAAAIPELVRYRMYHQDYGLTDYARRKYAGLAARAALPGEELLARAETVCPRRLPLRAMAREAAALLA